MLEEITASLDELLLDPNNPRFISDLRTSLNTPDSQFEKLQKDIRKRFSKIQVNDDEDVTNIRDLYDSMTTIGYVPIDRVVVRRIDGTDKYVVIEGNRRISTAKLIMDDYKNKEGIFDDIDRREKFESIKSSFEDINCMLFDTKGLSQDEVAHKISVILGLRHHGSLLGWEPLPKAYNIYKEYIELEPKEETFKFNTEKRNTVAFRLSISKKQVSDVLKTYVVYLQLSKAYPSVKSKHYSLIQAAVTNNKLKSYFTINEETFKLDDASLEKMNDICQFETRDQAKEEENIIKQPKDFSTFAKLLDMKAKSTDTTIKEHVDQLIERIIDPNDKTDIFSAVDEVTNLVHRRMWIQTIEAMLEKRETQLDFKDYAGEGNDLIFKNELKEIVNKLSRMVGV